ncbi:unnamed protein product [Didymodactylos carnosus]|uniref:Uncharacterized protein n=1 Tax=Didymodactylos carnosus TaxID=1234261 RepID=A0A8S2V4Q5_9BILA|nr:unnamed protein product [Didymodactylos carnosus]
MNNYDNLENIEDIVQETVDALVAMATMNTAPFVVNMLTAIPSQTQQQSASSNLLTEQKTFVGSVPTTTITNFSASTKGASMPPLPSNSTTPNYYRNDLAMLSSTASDIRNSMQLLQQQQIQTATPLSTQPTSSTFLTPTLQHISLHPSTTTSSSTISPLSSPMNNNNTNSINNPQIFLSDSPKTTTQQPTLFVTPNLPRILNIQTVVPKPTTNIQIGNTKIILVSPTNHHLHNQQQNTQHQQSPVKLVKFSNCPPPPLQTTKTIANPIQITTTNEFNQQQFQRRSTTAASGSTITLPAVQIVLPTQSQSSNFQFTRTRSDSVSSNNNYNNSTFRLSTSTSCDYSSMIPQAAQEITVTTSPTPAYSHSLSMSPLRSADYTDTSSSSALPSPTNTNNNQQQQYYVSKNDTSPFNSNHSVIITNNGNCNGNSKPRRRSSSSAPSEKPIGKVLRPIAKVLPSYPNG